jgi:hypothetical protein
MYRYVCQMFYKDKLYSGHYWKDEYSQARACRKMAELQRFHPAMRFVLTDYATGAIIKTTEHTIPKQERTYAYTDYQTA